MKRSNRWHEQEGTVDGETESSPGIGSAHSAFAPVGHVICQCARAQAPKPAEPPKTFDLAAIDAYVADQVRDQGYAGLSLAIVRDGKVVLAKGYGKRLVEEGAPVEPDTPFADRLGDQAVHLRLHSLAGRGREAVGRGQGREV